MTTYDNLEKILQQLREDPRPKIVEGKRDKQALQELGISNIKTLTTNLQDTAANTSEPIILTDYDRSGEKLKKRLEELLRNEGKKTNTEYRRKLRLLTGINTIEELLPRYREIEQEHRGEKHGKNIRRHS